MRFSFYTLGCKVNQYETQAMEQLLRGMGHEICGFEEACDGYIINTCSVTAVSDKKNRAVIRRCRREHPQALIGVCGCYSQHDPAAIEALGVDVVSGSGGREEFLNMMLSAIADRQKRTQVDNALGRRSFEVLPAGGLSQRTRAMIKVQDGCVNFCSYCIIPYTRGPVRSAPLELVVEQAKQLAEEGFREIVVTGIEIASWGVDLPGKPGLVMLLRAICEAVPGLRVRLGSLEPRIITEAFCRSLAGYDNLCPHFHLSMQSGSDTVLARMKRKYDTARYYESVKLLREYFPGCAITTDMIVAFPGETEEEFGESLAFMEKVGFAEMHIFPYSRRPGTPADKMPGQHPNAVKEDRSRRAIAVADSMNLAFRQAMEGQVVQVLFEEQSGPFATGHAPNYVRVYAPGKNLHNQIRFVRISGPCLDGVQGEILCQNQA
ncbi:MAG: tRNA (N(6)-L-threonylcarbamoyladenosine(37)-C(2))-methylthiotransferase MtaB [Oscillospiraceae bacterium]|nr:tRNA (N(6)-L-threonylcarbamoyladenosine(37)-C(2))-methylthiotransferase MtaB [Oscillospiraceae bacterium]MBR2889909.1 tRNA (N(6)-L-threonylcarbamoyladenosine(37)-C(2))-methylthiotransferase MtaB [Oscillospiraceae bacterium]